MGMVQRYRKILKISPGAYIFQRPFFEGLEERNLHFKIDWASLLVGSKFTVFALCCFVFEGYFPSTSPQGAYIWTWVFCVTSLGGLYLEGLIHGGAFFWNFTVCDVRGRNSKGRGGWGRE